MVQFIQTYNQETKEINDKLMSAYIEERAINYLTFFGLPGINVTNKPDGKFEDIITPKNLTTLEDQLNSFRTTIEDISSPREVSFGKIRLQGGRISKSDLKYRYSYDLFNNSPEVINSNIDDLIAISAKLLDQLMIAKVASAAAIVDADVDYGGKYFADSPLSIILRIAYSFRNENYGIDPNICILSPDKYLEFLDYMNTPQVAFQNNEPITNYYRSIGWKLGNISVIGAFNQLKKVDGTNIDALFLDSSRRSVEVVTQSDERYSTLPIPGTTINGASIEGNLFSSFNGSDPEVPDRLFTTIKSAADVQILNSNAIGAITTLPEDD